MTFEEFLGPPELLTHFKPVAHSREHVFHDRMHKLILRRVFLEKEGFTFYVCDMDEDPVLDAYKRAVGGSYPIPHIICVLLDSTRVGFIYSGSFYITPACRGRGVGTELVIQLFLLYGPKLWCERGRNPTPGALATYRRAYGELLRRGHIFDENGELAK